MQKSRNATIGIIILLFLYGIIANLKLVLQINRIYLYIINPLFWIITAILLKYILGKSYQNNKLKKEIIHYVLIAALIYIITYMVSGLFITFGNNPNFTTLKGFVLNLWMFGTVIVAREYIRYKLINNVYDKDKIKIAILISVVYVLLDMGISKYLGRNITVLFIIKEIAQTILPLVTKNLLYSYVAMSSGFLPAVAYELLTQLYMWVSPILPNSPWIMIAIIEIVIPFILFLYIRYINNKNSVIKSRQNITNTDPRGIIPLIVLIILGIWFAIRNISHKTSCSSFRKYGKRTICRRYCCNKKM